MIRYAYSRSAMLDAIGPSTPHDEARPEVGPPETRPWLGLRPYIPQYAAGMRMEPPPSAPRVTGKRPAATAYAEPPEEPPV